MVQSFAESKRGSDKVSNVSKQTPFTFIGTIMLTLLNVKAESRRLVKGESHD